MNNRTPTTQRILALLLTALILANVVYLLFVGWPEMRAEGPKPQAQAATGQPLSTPTVSTTPSSKPMASAPMNAANAADGLFLFSMSDGNSAHFFIYHPVSQPLQRITTQAGADRDPALSPDGQRIAFSSRRNGYWDLYILDLASGQVQRVTDTPEFEGSPSWSPDGQWLAYEAYNGNNLDIFLRSLSNPNDAPVQLTDDPGPDFAPAWSPQGRSIAFVSARSGEDEIWLALLDQIDNRFQNISQSPDTSESQPAWSPDGRYLAWGVDGSGGRSIVVWDGQESYGNVTTIGPGAEPAWKPDGSAILARISGPNQEGIAAYQFPGGAQVMSYTSLPASLHGLIWLTGPSADAMRNSAVYNPSLALMPTLWSPALTVSPISPAGRSALVSLPDVSAPYPYLLDSLDESFNAFRSELASQVGWDVLSSLENAYYPLTEPPSPGLIEDWLYTGRGFALNPLPFSAGWMVSVREDYNGQTYWRIYVKARYQDGSQGIPLSAHPWNLDARHSGDTRAYEQGGELAPIPDGYWLDLTDLAAQFGWQRLPALVDWRTYYAASRFNQFVIPDGLSWKDAMAQLYPEEAIATPTFVPTPTTTLTPTRTPWPGRRYYQTNTPTPTPVTPTATNRPTWTPLAATPTP
ncbi:periplasmic component of the Tol biopolymer transport system [Longilinea arvoryzae]|uniref:Periplasmic component of the Tol biopolymer transport system n=1 Tax=Longilinea arvoryzae TaxID=360412 RepID=A0A0S7BFU4_9CHLR|nr:DPP IV N-terminal domain-containing protein [Longilinea arvoryzae]GAP14393.1 periplasmic component of the Tol biopolymer transport system [Longilinea arvoryzae]